MSDLSRLTQHIKQSIGLMHKRDIAAVADMLKRIPFHDSAVPLGDDCAAIPDQDGFLLLATEGFLNEFVDSQPWFAGYCGVMVNVSDIYAMGGRPIAVVDAIWSDGEQKARPVLETLTRCILHMGATGSGQATKAVNQIMGAGINQAVAEALAFAQAQGLPMDKVIEVISGGASGNWFLQHRGSTMTRGIFAPGFKLALHHKDLKICQRMAKQSGASTTLIDMTLADYERLIAEGCGDEDISALYRLKAID
jgi:selenophosphate synthetase-related protein